MKRCYAICNHPHGNRALKSTPHCTSFSMQEFCSQTWRLHRAIVSVWLESFWTLKRRKYISYYYQGGTPFMLENEGISSPSSIILHFYMLLSMLPAACVLILVLFVFIFIWFSKAGSFFLKNSCLLLNQEIINRHKRI